MYDLICDGSIMLDILQDHSNLALQSNLLSLRNFCEISDGSLFRFMERVYFLTENHISKCDVKFKKKLKKLKKNKFKKKDCQNKGVICKICNSKKKIFSFEHKKKKCQKCKMIYHEKCYKQLNCIKCAIPTNRNKTNFKTQK